VNCNYVADIFDRYSTLIDKFDTLSLTASLPLKANDSFSMFLRDGFIYDDAVQAAQFDGLLVDEDF